MNEPSQRQGIVPLKKILVWDIPARLFHWAFAGSLTAAIAIGFLVDDDAPLFQLHMLFGIVALFLLSVRVVMGVAGSWHSRFASFPVQQREVIGYLISAAVSKTKLHAGNNPGSAVAAVLIFLPVPASQISGIGYGGEALEELHLAGLAWHTIRHRENFSLAIVTGRKSGKTEDAISSSHAVWACSSPSWQECGSRHYSPRAIRRRPRSNCPG